MDGRAGRSADAGARRIAPLVAAAAVVTVAAVVLALLRHDHGPTLMQPVGQGGSPSTSMPAPLSACSGNQLSGSVNGTHTGQIAGTQKVVIDLRNVSLTACWLDGFPVVYAVDGAQRVAMPFPQLPNTFARDVDGPGLVSPGAIGRLSLSIQIRGCSKTMPSHDYLEIQVAGGGDVTMDFPKELARSGCAADVTEVGPVTANE